MQKTEPSLQTLTLRLNQRQVLEWVEYLSLVGSAVGTIVAAASKEVIFAAAPLTLAVSLNFLNRTRMGQKSELPPDSQLTSTTPSLDDIFPYLPPASSFDLSEIEREIAELRGSLTSARESTAAEIAEIRQQLPLPPSAPEPTDLNSIWQALRELQSTTERLDKTALTERDWETVNVQFLLVKEAIAQLKQTSGEPSDLSKIEAAIAALHAEIQSQHSELQGRIEQLEQKNREIVKPYLKRLVADVQQLKQRSRAQS